MQVWWLMGGIGVVFVVTASVLLGRRRSTDGHLSPRPTIIMLSTLLYGFALFAVSLLPLPASAAEACVDGGRDFRLTSLITFAEAWNIGRGSPSTFLSGPSFVQLLSNVLLFVPFGLVIGGRTRWRLFTAAALGLAVSMLLELTQATGAWGLYECAYRTGDLQDLVTNTSGAVIGWLLGRRLLSRRPWPDRVTER